MSATVSFLKQLLSTPGLSVSKIIQNAWQPLSDEIHTSRLGSLHALKRGRGPEPRPSLLLAAHMDAIGLMVAGIEGEFLRLSPIGGVDPRVLPGQPVTVHGRRDLPGVIVQPPPHLLPPGSRAGLVQIANLLVDTGQPAQVIQRQVRPGDLVSFATPPTEINARALFGPSLDNRASVAALTSCLQALQNRDLFWDVWAVATVQEEVSVGGATTSAFQLQPSLAVAIDVTYGAGPGSPNHETFPLDKGPTLGWGPSIHPKLFQRFKELAEELELPYNLEIMPTRSGTDADSMQLTAAGIPTMVISIPLRYMHTPVEMVSLRDITRTGRLLAEFAARLDESSLTQLTRMDD